MDGKQSKGIVKGSEADKIEKNPHSEEIEQNQQASDETTSPGHSSHQESFSSYTELPAYLKGGFEEWLSLKDKQRLVNADNTKGSATAGNKFFKPSLDEDKLNYPILKGMLKKVLTGDPVALINLLQQDSSLFFMKYKAPITDPAQQTFRDVSPADLISFLGESDMQKQVNDFAQNLEEPVRTQFFERWEEHQSSPGLGGADIVMTSGEIPPEFAAIFKVKTEVNVWGKKMPLERELLKNPDGIVCWKDPHDNALHWYYANPATKTLEEIEISQELLLEHQAEYDTLTAKMKSMEPQTARRSSNQEWELFKDIMLTKETKKPIYLVRQGIHYQQDGIDFIDTHYDANRWINALLKCIRLYDAGTKITEANRAWRKELGHVEREVIWGVQRICEERSFWPLADDYENTPFVRGFNVYNLNTSKNETVFNQNTEEFSTRLGLDDASVGFAIYKTAGPRAGRDAGSSFFDVGVGRALLVAVNRLFIDANKKVDGFRPEVSTVATPGPNH